MSHPPHSPGNTEPGHVAQESRPDAKSSETPLTLRAREPYIPYSRAEILDRCASRIASGKTAEFRRFARILSAWFHHEYYSHLERLKLHYLDTPETFAADLDHVVRAANFSPITHADLQAALNEESLFRVRLSVDFSDFEEIVFYARGETQATATVQSWFGLRTRTISFSCYELVVVYVRFCDSAHFTNSGQKPELLPFAPGSSLLKLFQSVPKADLEMLFPNTRVRMRGVDKLLIGVPAVASGVVVLTTKLGGTILLVAGLVTFWLGMSSKPIVLDQAALLALITAAGAVGAYLWKQYSNFKNRKILFMKTLAENLYFKNLDNDVGVLTHLIDRAEESETKEVLMAYTELLVSGSMLPADLKRTINDQYADVDFDIDDAVRKLTELGLVQSCESGLKPLPIDEAFATIDARWDAVFAS